MVRKPLIPYIQCACTTSVRPPPVAHPNSRPTKALRPRVFRNGDSPSAASCWDVVKVKS
ncbi:hypothetical protein BD414DRAFT_499172 [Trametes punicea]|nr:hypothetical protein BD414DRAFT_499172 [Trametes punicea]